MKDRDKKSIKWFATYLFTENGKHLLSVRNQSLRFSRTTKDICLRRTTRSARFNFINRSWNWSGAVGTCSVQCTLLSMISHHFRFYSSWFIVSRLSLLVFRFSLFSLFSSLSLCSTSCAHCCFNRALLPSSDLSNDEISHFFFHFTEWFDRVVHFAFGRWSIRPRSKWYTNRIHNVKRHTAQTKKLCAYKCWCCDHVFLLINNQVKPFLAAVGWWSELDHKSAYSVTKAKTK